MLAKHVEYPALPLEMPYRLISHHTCCTPDGMEMFLKGDEAHLQAMGKMQELMQESPEMEMGQRMEHRREEFEPLPGIG